MLCGSLVLNDKESLSWMGDLFIWLSKYYLLPPFHMLCGSLVLNVEEHLSGMSDLLIRLSRYLPSATTSYVVWIAGPQCRRNPVRNGRSFRILFRYLPSATTSCAVWIAGPQCWRIFIQNGRFFDKIVLTFCHHFICCVDRWSSMLKNACPEWAILW